MSHKKSSSVNGKSPAQGNGLDEQELAELLALPTWNQQQAEKILQAQVASRQGIAAFAKQRGQTAGRIYNWKTKLKQKAMRADPVGATGEQQESSPSVLGAGLDLEDPGERHALKYLERATSGPDRMWRLLDLRRSGSVLLCAVHWVQRSRCPEPYSLVHLALTEPALWWNDFATGEQACQALQQHSASPGAPQRNEEKVVGPALVKVEVRAPMAQPQREHERQGAADAQRTWITVCMPAGERIQIPPGVPEALIRTVLRTVRSPSC
jgi:hypothetical protein